MEAHILYYTNQYIVYLYKLRIIVLCIYLPSVVVETLIKYCTGFKNSILLKTFIME